MLLRARLVLQWLLKEDTAWRTHVVPTFADTDESWFFGLSLKQIIGVILTVSLGFLPFFWKLGLFLLVGFTTLMLILIRPDGRSICENFAHARMLA